jgi:hypothetical protein
MNENAVGTEIAGQPRAGRRPIDLCAPPPPAINDKTAATAAKPPPVNSIINSG